MSDLVAKLHAGIGTPEMATQLTHERLALLSQIAALTEACEAALNALEDEATQMSLRGGAAPEFWEKRTRDALRAAIARAQGAEDKQL